MINKNTDNPVPQTTIETTKLRALVRDYAASSQFVPPLQESEVLYHSQQIIERHPEYKAYEKLLAVMVSNEAWSSVVGSIPFERRILLLPKCFRDVEGCPAQIDELGVLCEECGRCDIGDIMREAESLGYSVLVSEGTTAVSMLLSSGQVECVIGVGCVHSFERSFPAVLRDAIPAMAVPLQNSNCLNSTIDREWLSDVLSLKNSRSWNGQLNLDSIKESIAQWFAKDQLLESFNSNNDQSMEIACDWLSRGGKLWRPLLLTALYKALSGNSTDNESLQKLALAIECFHKASLVHDDIEDDDCERYGQKTLHLTHGMPVALNIGDLLIGLGYQMIAACGASATQISQLTSIAAQGHRELCLGQGQELIWDRKTGALSVEETLQIFRYKTAPAFEVALKMGAALAGRNESFMLAISQFSTALGVAYQIKDDLDDFESEHGCDISNLRPSLLIALAAEKDNKAANEYIIGIFEEQPDSVKKLKQFIAEENIVDKAKTMFNHYRQAALNALKGIDDIASKALLHRLTNRILGTVE